MQEKEQYELRMLMHSLSTMVENLQAAQEMDCVQSICQLHYPELAETLVDGCPECEHKGKCLMLDIGDAIGALENAIDDIERQTKN